MIDTNSSASKQPGFAINPGEISIILATRGRPELLAQLFDSLRTTTAQKDKAAIWLYVDDDDFVTLQAIEDKTLPDPGLAVHWHIGPQPGGLGQTHQALWKASRRTSQVYVTIVDDARFTTPAWDNIVRAKFDEYPDGILLAFPHDPLTADQATYPIFGWGWLQTLENIYPGYFPYWFDDKWVDQIARMAGRYAKLPVEVPPTGGKGRTKRMRNHAFWTRFFQITLEERKTSARKLIAAMYPHDEAKRSAANITMETVAKGYAQEKAAFSDAYCVFQEERHTEMTSTERQKFNLKYYSHEAKIVGWLIVRAQELINQKNIKEALEFLEAIQFSDIKVRQADVLRAECLLADLRIAEANALIKENCAAWPQMNNLRRAFRFLGMVANDGKRMLMGLTSKDKTNRCF